MCDRVDVFDDDVGATPEAENVYLERFAPLRPGWGRRPDERFLHTVPESHGGPGKKRAIFRHWPRASGGMPIIPSEKPKGTLSPDGYPWGATLYDIYSVFRVPELQSLMSFMTGSALLEEMKALNELDVAAPEIEWAMTEGKPRDEGVADTEELIKCQDVRMSFFDRIPGMDEGSEKQDEKMENGKGATDHVPGGGDKGNNNDRDHAEEDGGDEGKSGQDEEERDEGGDGDEDEDGQDVEGERDEEGDEGGDEDEDEEDEQDEEDEDREDEQDDEDGDGDGDGEEKSDDDDGQDLDETESDDEDGKGKFFPSFGGFEPILLQERIPLYLLPRTLYVHDPFKLLRARQDTFFRDMAWNSRPDIVRTYNLKLSEYTIKECEEARKKVETLEEFKARTLIVLRYKRTKQQIRKYEPVIEVPLPPYQRRMTRTEESHLYISPVAKVGKGHHSVVYKGDLELPRGLFVKPTLCAQCFKESADNEIQRLKDTGRWAKLLRAGSWGPRGLTGHKPTAEELAAVCDPPSLERDGEIIEREIICVVPPNIAPSQVLEVLNERNVWDMFMKKPGVNSAIIDFAESMAGGQEKSTDDYVAIIRIDPSYKSEEKCTHLHRSPATSHTAKFHVIAKLSLEDDLHLAREAENYQLFPERFFHHYDGYTIIPQLHAVVPVHAVVPQFYGYYTPKQENKYGGYLSPILLLEHCGKPIEPEKLSLEDQEECASLVLRFQRAGWLHESMAQRNFMVQKGKPTEFPMTRQVYPELSFRLIDFGRSRKYAHAHEKQGEEREALYMFRKFVGQMGVTFRV